MLSDNFDQFAQQMTSIQRQLYTYILMLLPSHGEAEEVLQQTNLVAWGKRGEFTAGTNFRAWISKIAFFEVLDYRKRKRRDRLVFNDKLIEEMAQEASKADNVPENSMYALSFCINSLKAADRVMLDLRYKNSRPIGEIAEAVGRTPPAVRQALFRIREFLIHCVRQRLKQEEHA